MSRDERLYFADILEACSRIQRLAGFRDVAAHEYFGIDFALVSDIVETEIPALRAAIERLLAP